MTLAELMMLFSLSVIPPNLYVRGVATHFGQNPDLAILTWKYESSYGTDLYGDWDKTLGEYLAQGPWQIHPGTWQYLVRRYQEDYGAPDWWMNLEARHNMEVTTVITMYAWSIGHEDWWAGYRKAKVTALAKGV